MFEASGSVRLADPVEVGEDLLLEVEVLEHRFDDDVAGREIAAVERRCDQRHPLVHLARRHGTPGRRPLIVAADDRHASVQRGLIPFDDGDRDPDVGEVHGDAAAHGSGTEHTTGADVELRCVTGNVRDLGRLPLCEEVVPLGRGLCAPHQLLEQFTFLCDTGVEVVEVDRGLDALDVVLRGLEATGPAGDRGPEIIEQPGVGPIGLHLVPEIPQPFQRHALGDGPLGEGHRPGFVIVDDVVDQAEIECLLGTDRITLGHHLQRLCCAGDTGQALRAAGAGEQAELDLRETEPGGRYRHPVVGAHRHLEPASQRGAVDTGDHRFRAVLHRGLDLIESGALRRLSELADVGSGDEGPTSAGEDDGLDLGICHRSVDPVEDALANVMAQGVDRGIVDDDQGDIAPLFQADRFGECAHGPRL